MITPPDTFRTERLVLRRPALDDATAIYEEYAADSEVTRYMTWRPHSSSETVAAFLSDLIERWTSGHEFAWMITLGRQNRAIGMLSARIHGHKGSIGYVLGRSHWNRGYMTEAIGATAVWVLAQPAIFRVGATCDIENVGSARALEKSGFEREGILRRWITHPNVSLEPRDCYVYSRVK